MHCPKNLWIFPKYLFIVPRTRIPSWTQPDAAAAAAAEECCCRRVWRVGDFCADESVLLTLGFLYWVGVWTWQTLLERLDSKEWLVVCEALTHTRQLSIFHTKLLLPIL